MIRELARAMNAAGYHRDWRFRRDALEGRKDAGEALGLRWCLQCGRELARELRTGAFYCSRSCAELARRKRMARGVRLGRAQRGTVLIRRAGLDAAALRSRRAEAFYLCHGQPIDRAPEICRRWGEPARPRPPRANRRAVPVLRAAR